MHRIHIKGFLCCIFSSAVGNADFVALDAAIPFGPGENRMCVNISVLNDNIYEDPENFSVVLGTEDESVDVDPTRQTGTATITDDDGKKIKISVPHGPGPPFILWFSTHIFPCSGELICL